jgi:flavin reductase (DIM6/NTAB) family NADH-FMN oxidoreductase RutF
MLFDFAKLDAPDCYKLLASTIVPRPIAWIVSQDEAGQNNLSAFSYFNILTNDPAVVAIGISNSPGGQPKDTMRNIRATGEFTVCLVSEPLAQQMNVTAIEFPADVDEMKIAGLAAAPSTLIKPPRVADSPVALECSTYQLTPVGDRWTIVLGRVLAMHVRDDCVLDASRHYIDTPKLQLIARMHGRGWYARTSDLYEIPRQTIADWNARQE